MYLKETFIYFVSPRLNRKGGDWYLNIVSPFLIQPLFKGGNNIALFGVQRLVKKVAVLTIITLQAPNVLVFCVCIA